MQTFADAQILIYPASAIPARSAIGFIVADQLADFARPGWSDALGILPESLTALNPTVSIPWAQTPRTLGIDNLHFARFHRDGTLQFGASSPRDGAELASGDLAGFFLLPRAVFLDCRINGSGATSGKTAINWDGEAGTWQTLPALSPDVGSAVYTTGGDAKHQARTHGPIPANRSFRVQLDFLLQGKTGTHPTVRYRWGDEWAITFRHNLNPIIERAIKTDSEAGEGFIDLHWSAIKTLNGAPKTDMRGHSVTFDVVRLAGRLCLTIGGASFWLLDVKPGQTPEQTAESQAQGETKPKPPAAQEIDWDDAPHGIEAFNVRVAARLAMIKWSSASGDLAQGTLSRSVTRNSPLGGTEENPPEAQGTCSGWKRGGTQAIVNATIGAGSVDYVLQLMASEDGIDTPFISKIGVRYAPTWTNPNPAPIDVRGAALGLSVTLGMPPKLDGAQCSVTLDRALLDLQNPGWQNYAQMWNPLEIRVRRAGTTYKRLFKGYIFKPDMGSDDTLSRTLTIVGRDSMVRAQKIGEVHNCVIDHRFPPLDILFAEKIAAATGGYGADGRPASDRLYIAHCIQETARIGLGDEIADNINGNGDPLRFLPANHPPLFSTSNDLAGWAEFDVLTGKGPVVSEGGWMLPAPFGKALYDWWGDFAKRDFCDFYFRYLDGQSGDWPCLVYGRPFRILGSEATQVHVVKDVIVGGNWERLLHSAQVERRPERDANRFLVVGDETPGLSGLLPSLRMAEAQLSPNDPRHARFSWERTLWVREPSALLGAEAIANGIASQLAGVDMRWPTLDFEGDERIDIGDVLQPVFSGELADTALGISGKKYRIELMTHTVNFTQDGGAYRINVSPRPLTAQEAKAL